jgi:SAM-dependent methyltransferase
VAERYVGSELEVFQHAHNWKRYFGDTLRAYITGDVVEVGAGFGGTTGAVMSGGERSWTCVEPDPELAARIAEQALPLRPEVVVGTLADVDAAPRFDCVLYLDVLEHIEDDRGELGLARDRLRPGGHVVVLAPAYNFLFSEFDEAIGHHRRYTRSALRALTPDGLIVERAFYLDALGVLLSLGNRLLLRSGSPTHEQIGTWDRFVVPLSRAIADRALRRRVGRSVVVVWKKR